MAGRQTARCGGNGSSRQDRALQCGVSATRLHVVERGLRNLGGKRLVATLMDHVDFLLCHAVVVHNLSFGVLAHGNNAVGGMAGVAELVVVDLPVNPVVVLWSVDEDKVVYGHHAAAVAAAYVEGQLVAEPVKQLYAVVAQGGCHAPHAPQLPQTAPQAFGREALSQARNGGYLVQKRRAPWVGHVEAVFVFGVLLREDAQHEAAVVSQPCAVLCRPLGVESYFHNLEIAEKFWLYHESHTQARVKLVVVEQVLSVSVVVLHEKKLIVFLEHSVVELPDGVVAQPPSAAFDERQAKAETLVGGGVGHAGLVDAAVVEDVFVVHAVDDGNPRFAVNHEIRVDEDVAGKRNLVPAARIHTVASV